MLGLFWGSPLSAESHSPPRFKAPGPPEPVSSCLLFKPAHRMYRSQYRLQRRCGLLIVTVLRNLICFQGPKGILSPVKCHRGIFQAGVLSRPPKSLRAGGLCEWLLWLERERGSLVGAVSYLEAETGQVGCRRKSWLQKCITLHICLLWKMRIIFFFDGSSFSTKNVDVILESLKGIWERS